MPKPPSNGDLCEDCGHQAYSHQLLVCMHPYRCVCGGMLWQGRRWRIPLTGQPEPVETPPMSTDHVCPECRTGKHGNCDGMAWDLATDAATECRCPHLVEWTTVEETKAGMGQPTVGQLLGMTKDGDLWCAPLGTERTIASYPPPPPWTYLGKVEDTQEDGLPTQGEAEAHA